MPRVPAPVDQPREHLMSLGTAALSDAELVAIHLGTGCRGEGVLGLARLLLAEWGGVAGLARADVDELSRMPGVTAAKACRLIAAFALADRTATPGGQIGVREYLRGWTPRLESPRQGPEDGKTFAIVLDTTPAPGRRARPGRQARPRLSRCRRA